jgi:hypothetical protein
MDKAVGFTKSAADRVGRVVRAAEKAGTTGATWWDHRADDGASMQLGKTTAAWSKGAKTTVDIYTGTPGTETKTGTQDNCVNKFADIASGKWVMLAGLNGGWYVISAECS